MIGTDQSYPRVNQSTCTITKTLPYLAFSLFALKTTIARTSIRDKC